MKQYIFLLSLLACICGIANNTYAGFLVKKQPYTSGSSGSVAPGVSHTDAAPVSGTSKDHNIQKLSTFRHVIPVIRESRKASWNHRPGNDSGWQGIVALICGILGFVVLVPFIPAIIFGIMGLHKRHHGMAVAGLVLGSIIALMVLIYLIVIVGIFG